MFSEESNHSGKLFRSEGVTISTSLLKLLKGFCDPHRSHEEDGEDAITLSSSHAPREHFPPGHNSIIEVFASPRKSSCTNLKDLVASSPLNIND